jgi:hypothetical protein
MEPLASRRVKASKLFSIGEANALVPRLELLMSRLQQGALRLEEERQALAQVSGHAADQVSTEELLRQRPQARVLVEELDGVVRDIEEIGVHLKDIRQGLVDFPYEMGGEVVYLCWQSGEPEVAFWHRIDDGFAGRQPLPGSARQPSLQ